MSDEENDPAKIAGHATTLELRGKEDLNPTSFSTVFSEKWSHLIIGSSLGGGIFLILIFILVCVCVSKERAARKSEKTGQEVSRQLIKDYKSALAQRKDKDLQLHYLPLLVSNHPTMSKSSDFKKDVGKSKWGFGKNQNALDEIRYEKFQWPGENVEMKRIFDGELVTSDRAAYPDVEIIESTQVPVMGQHVREKDRQFLHANTLPDAQGNDIIMCQEPSENLMAYHWEMIWQRNVGVIVWLGPIDVKSKAAHDEQLKQEKRKEKKDKDKEKEKKKKEDKPIDPYIGMDPREEVYHGRFGIRTLAAVNYKRYCNVYELLVRNENFFQSVDHRGQEYRKIWVCHIPDWPKTLAEANREKLALLLETVRAKAASQASSECLLPGIVVHCNTGLEMTGCFCAMYVNRQLHHRYGAFNIKGVLQLIARTRYKAWHSEASVEQIQILYSVMMEFAEKYPVMDKSSTSGNADSEMSSLKKHLAGSNFDQSRKPSHLECIIPRRAAKTQPLISPSKSGGTSKSGGLRTAKSLNESGASGGGFLKHV